MNHKTATAQILELIARTNSPASLSTGDMAVEIARRLEPGVSVRITSKGVRVTHSRYVDNLNDPSSIDDALSTNEWIKCEAA